MSVNKVILVGHMGKDPEIKQSQNGTAIASASLATSESWKDKDGNKQDKTEWHRLVFFARLAEIVNEYCRKGSQIYIEGRLQTRKWQDQSGQDRYTTEILVKELKMLGSKRESESNNEPEQINSNNEPQKINNYDELYEDGIPF